MHHELALLFDETVALYLRLTATASAIYRQGAMSGPPRTVLVAVARSGPQTVAQLARARAVAPAHRRSPIVGLTPDGRKAIRRILETRTRCGRSFASRSRRGG